MNNITTTTTTTKKGKKKTDNIFNFVMVDSSGSMYNYRDFVKYSWNTLIAPKLLGHTVIYTFGESVTFRSERTDNQDTSIENIDFNERDTDLSGALQTIINEVYTCKEKYVNIFLVTDGDHRATRVQPSSVIDKMQIPIGKICSVYILGLGEEFPVQYSVDIRSRLHNGSTNIASLFWAKCCTDIMQQMTAIRSNLCEGTNSIVELKDIPGYSLPGLLPPGKKSFHLGEWVYFDCCPEQLKKLQIKFKNMVGILALEPYDATIDDIDQLICQWNSIIIQKNNNKETIPDNILHFIEKIVIDYSENFKSGTGTTHSILHRIQRKEFKTKETQLKNKMKILKNILTTANYENQLELAENILNTTVTTEKYKIKALRLKGHTNDDYDQNCLEFKQVYNQHIDQIKNIPDMPEDRCRVTMISTLSDLQDPYFLKLLEENNKFEFLKEFTITGIPVYAPMRDSMVMNPWSFCVRSMLIEPYAIMSQNAMEFSAGIKRCIGKDKIIQLKDNKDEEDTQYNAIVPIFPLSYAKAMQPIVLTRLYAMCVTFSTLKNPHIIDYDIHMASLAATWIHCLVEYPNIPRPEHIKIRMESIEATAALYMKQPRFARYVNVLLKKPHQALMTESTEEIDGKLIKCETLIKPMFLLFMCKKYDEELVVSKKDAVVDVNTAEIVRLLLVEYIGRYLSHYYKNYITPFTDFFVDRAKKNDLVTNVMSDMRVEIIGNEKTKHFEDIYTLEKVHTFAKNIAKDVLDIKIRGLLANLPLKLNIDTDEKLCRNTSSAGDVSWFTLKVFGKEMGLSAKTIEELFSEENIFVYTTHALLYRSSKSRLSNPISNYSESRKLVIEKVQEEMISDVSKMFIEKITSYMEDIWLKKYLEVHNEVVRPMSRQEILQQAQERGIEVTDSTFDCIYGGYRTTTGLLRNACQTRKCPHFLVPNKSYNQHAVVERKRSSNFIHGFHKIAYACRNTEDNFSKSELFENNDMLRTKNIVVPENTWENLKDCFQLLRCIYKKNEK